MILSSKALRIIFFGTTYFAAYHLYMLILCSNHKISAVITQEKALPSNNKHSLPFTLNKISKKFHLPFFQSNTLSMSNIIHIVKKFKSDIIVVVSYGLILPQEILNIPQLGCINIHGSLLPRWRGPAPIQRALEHGDVITGISIIQMDQGIDTGNILYTESCNIFPKDTNHTLSERLSHIGSNALLYTLEQLVLGTHKIIIQDSTNATYAHKINKSEARINWNLSATQIERCIRAFNPWPVSYFQVKKNHIRIRVWEAEVNNQNINNYCFSLITPGTILTADTSGIHVSTGSGILILTVLQITGKKKTLAKDILNAYRTWFIPYSVLE